MYTCRIIGTVLPGKSYADREKQVVERPCNNHIIVECHERAHDNHRDSDAFESRCEPPTSEWSVASELPKRLLEEHKRQREQRAHHQERHKEASTAALIGHVREAPAIDRESSQN